MRRPGEASPVAPVTGRGRGVSQDREPARGRGVSQERDVSTAAPASGELTCDFLLLPT